MTKCKKLIACILIITIFSSVSIPAFATENSTDPITVYFYNEYNWTQPTIYYYSGNTAPTSWPGTPMNNDGNNWYSFTIEDLTTARVILSDNGQNQNPAQNQPGFLVSGEKWYVGNNWHDEDPTNIKTTVHFYNEYGYDTPYMYYYSGDETPIAWPGVPMTSDGNGWYSYDIYGYTEARVIFSDNGQNQYPAQGTDGIYATGEKWHSNQYMHDNKPEGITVNFYNYDNWDNVNIYYYSENKYGVNENSAWDGQPMLDMGNGWYSKTIYSYTSAKVLFNNGNGTQIPAQNQPGYEVWQGSEYWYRDGIWSQEKPQDITIYFHKPENWGDPNLYYYKNSTDTGKAWPGEDMDSLGDDWYAYTITKYSQAKILFNDGNNQIPPQNQPGLDVSGVMWYKDGVLASMEDDTDQDGLNDYMEFMLNTDITDSDTDNDQLPDGYEFNVLNSDPLKADSDNNGIPDNAEDFDNDGLNNLQEYNYQTSPIEEDTDEDGLNDYEEINTYNTDPLLFDTDDDGLSDGKEIKFGTNPLIPNQAFDINLENEETDTVKASVSLNITGTQAQSLKVEKVVNDILFPTTIPGYIGSAYDFTVDGTFNQATISFEFDNELLQNENFNPTIYYFDEVDQELEPLQTTITNNVASAVVNHFSTYILIDRQIFDQAFTWRDVWSDKEYTGMEVVLVIDDSQSMSINDSQNQRLNVSKNLIANLPEDTEIGIVKFERYTTILTQTLTQDKEAAKTAIDNGRFTSSIRATYMYTAIEDALNLFSPHVEEDTIFRSIIVLTDGASMDSSKYTSVANKLLEENIKLYAVELGSYNTQLRTLATNTSGKFYNASVAQELTEIYGDIGERINMFADTDGDGISDYYEENMVAFNGVKIETDKNNPDTDGDGLLDGEEIIVAVVTELEEGETKFLVRGKIKSYPTKADSDNDGLYDSEEVILGTDILGLDTDGDGITDGDEVDRWFDPLNANYDGDHLNDLQEIANGSSPYVYDKNGWENTGDFFLGLLTGDFIQDTDSVPLLIGQITSGLIPYVGVVADARDVVGNAGHGEWGFALLSAAGIVPVAGDIAKGVSKVSKVVLKNIDNIPFVVDVLKNAAKIHPDMAKALSKNDDIRKSIDKILSNPQKITKADYDELLKMSKNSDEVAQVVKLLDGMEPSEIIKLTPRELYELKPNGWKYYDNTTSTGNRFIHIKNNDGQVVIRIDPPDNVTQYTHIHIYDTNRNSLDINGNIVDYKDPLGHIKYDLLE